MGVARVQVAAEWVREVLHFPVGCDVRGAWYDPLRGVVELLVVGDDLPALPADGLPAAVWASYARRSPLPEVCRLLGDGILFVGWGAAA